MRYKITIALILYNVLLMPYSFANITIPTHNKSLNSSAIYQNCFKNSTWIVPPQTLLAYKYEQNNVTAVINQTVWVLSGYNQGYFFGKSYTTINNTELSQRSLIGSVTDTGKVYITFYETTSSPTDLVTGLGELSAPSTGKCSFTMQMNSSQSNSSGITHWSYMIPVNPGDYFYNNLPSTNMSVPEFLAQFQYY